MSRRLRRWAAYSPARGEWDEAVRVYRVALEAAELVFDSRLDTSSRAREIRAIGALPRWSAFALAQTGDLAGAAVALDAGRTRELRRRLGASRDLWPEASSLPTAMRAEYEAAAAAFVSVRLNDAASAEARRYQEVVARIRDLPGFEGFAADSSARDIAAACESGWPLLYVNPTPGGTLLLLVAATDGGEVAYHARFLEDVRGIDVFMHLIASDELGSRSYLFAVGSEGTSLTDEEFRATLDATLSWLGEKLARPIGEFLADVGSSGVTLVVSGPGAATPLHAAPWREGASMRCLLNDFDVRYAPSASLAAVARRRAAKLAGRAPTFVGLGDPQSNLPAAGPEVEEIAKLFPSGATSVALRDDADAQFLRSHAVGAQYLHLACHARGALFDRADAAVDLSDGQLSADDLTAYELLTTRLVAVSACESGLAEISGMPDEVLSIGTAMLAAGSACAVVSLWPVDDAAAAVLMLRLYHEMLENGYRPPEALRRAELWLRDLTLDDEQRFLAQHPLLEAEFRRRAERRDRPGQARAGHRR